MHVSQEQRWGQMRARACERARTGRHLVHDATALHPAAANRAAVCLHGAENAQATGLCSQVGTNVTGRASRDALVNAAPNAVVFFVRANFHIHFAVRAFEANVAGAVVRGDCIDAVAAVLARSRCAVVHA